MDYFDLHCDTIYELSRYAIYSKTNGTLRKNSGQLDLARAAQFGQYAQVFALFCGAKPVENPADAHERFTHLLETARQAFGENTDCLMHCKTAVDFTQAKQQRKTAAFLSIEGAELLQSAQDIQAAIDAGVRIVTLAWNHCSIYGCGASTDNKAGLTMEGKQLTQYLSANDVFLDVSHLSERGFWDLAECISAPILATHSNSKAVCSHVRNLTDTQFDEIVRRGGLVGINFYVPFLTKRRHAACEDILRHIEHFCVRGGEKCLCIGADWDGCDQLPNGILDITGVELLAEILARHGYSDEQIADLFYNNANQFVLANF